MSLPPSLSRISLIAQADSGVEFLMNNVVRFVIVMCSNSLGLVAQSTVFVVRHAERPGAEPDPPITEEGFRRADMLAHVLGDARITHVYTSEALRTQQTAAPTARRFGVEPVVVDAQDLAGLIRRVRETLRKDEATLVVGHRASVPRIVRELSGKDIPPLDVGEHDRMVVVTIFPDGKTGVVTLRFGNKPDSRQSR